MSQIFDSLRRSRKSDARSTPSRTAHGDAVLATLGYAPPRRRRQYLPVVVCAVLGFAIAAIGWITWRAYLDADAAIVPSSRVMSPGMPKPAAPLPRPAPPTLNPVPNVSADGVANAVQPLADQVSRTGFKTVSGAAGVGPSRYGAPRPDDPSSRDGHNRQSVSATPRGRSRTGALLSSRRRLRECAAALSFGARTERAERAGPQQSRAFVSTTESAPGVGARAAARRGDRAPQPEHAEQLRGDSADAGTD